MPYDHLAHGELLEKEVHRRKHYPFIYYCPACNRSYLAKTREEACKFCDGPVKLVTGGKRYIYFCETCDTRIESDEPKMACATCGKRVLTLYRWDMLDKRERKRIKIARFLKSLSAALPRLPMKGKIAAPKIAIPKIAGPKITEIKKWQHYKGEELPSDEIWKPREVEQWKRSSQ